ncbi:MAG: superoxide dismutase family protein [Ekhidna sp.]
MKKLAILPLFILLISCSKDESTTPGVKTFAAADIYTVLSEDGANYQKGNLIGNVDIEYQDSVITMTVSITNMEPNTSHAMHLHMGTLEKPGHHWNQGSVFAACNKRSLGSVWARPNTGDIGNIDIDDEGNGTFTIETDLWTLGTNDERDVAGTVLYIHHKEEDFIAECDPNHDHDHGHTNAKIAGGTIVYGSQILN